MTSNHEDTIEESVENVDKKFNLLNYIKSNKLVITFLSFLLIIILYKLSFIIQYKLSISILFGVSTVILIALSIYLVFIKNKIFKRIYMSILFIIFMITMFDTFIFTNQISYLNKSKEYNNEKIVNVSSTNLGHRFETKENKDGIYTGYTVDRNGLLQIEKSADNNTWYVSDKLKDKEY